MKGLQKFTREYIEQCRRMSPDAIVQFLEDFRVLHGPKAKSRPKSLKVQEPVRRARATRPRSKR